MFKSMNQSARRIPIWVLLPALTILAGALGIFASSSSTNNITNINSTAPLFKWKGQERLARISVTRITAQPFGFEPEEFTLPNGPLHLALENRTGFKQLTWSLAPEQGAKFRELTIQRGSKKYTESYDLPPGAYILSATELPGRICRIVISEK